MAVKCDVIPRRDLNAEQCKALGEAIYGWIYADSATRHVEGFGVDDLGSGALPQQLWIQRLIGIEGRGLSEQELKEFNPPLRTLTKEQRQEVKESFGGLAEARVVRLAVFKPHSDYRDRIIESLRAFIPSELIEDILVDGRSWQIP